VIGRYDICQVLYTVACDDQMTAGNCQLDFTNTTDITSMYVVHSRITCQQLAMGSHVTNTVTRDVRVVNMVITMQNQWTRNNPTNNNDRKNFRWQILYLTHG